MTIHTRSNRQYVAMGDAEVWHFIDDQKVMLLSFMRDDGYPHLSPIWHVTLDATIYFRATSNKVKAKIADGTKVCCAVETGLKFTELRGAIVWGTTQVVHDEQLQARFRAALTEKYAGLSSADLDVPEAWAEKRAVESQTVIAITPERISSWDNRKLDSWTA